MNDLIGLLSITPDTVASTQEFRDVLVTVFQRLREIAEAARRFLAGPQRRTLIEVGAELARVAGPRMTPGDLDNLARALIALGDTGRVENLFDRSDAAILGEFIKRIASRLSGASRLRIMQTVTRAIASSDADSFGSNSQASTDLSTGTLSITASQVKGNELQDTSNGVKIKFPSGASNPFSDTDDDSTVSLSVAKIPTTTVGDLGSQSNFFEINAAVDGDVRSITGVTDGIELRLELTTVPANPRCAFFNVDTGAFEMLPGSVQTTGSVTEMVCTTTHLSTFAVINGVAHVATAAVALLLAVVATVI
jgi:hypothetical protein